MKKFFALLLLFATVMAANAKSLVFTLSDGTLVYYLLGGETNPVMKFVDGKIVVNTDTYEFTNVSNFYISDTDDPTAVNSLETKSEASFKGNTLVVKGGNAVVKVYSVNGSEVEASVNKADGYITIDLNPLQKGNYVVKVGASSFKVMKK